MIESTTPPKRIGPPPRGITQSDVSHAADSLLRAGERPTIEKIRAKMGKGSPNTINPMLDAWWKTLSARLDAGPAALHRLPEPIAHIAEALWMQALEEGKRRAALEQRDSARVAELDKQGLEIRSHVLSLREGELDSRMHDRDRTIHDLNQRLRELSLLLRKEQATRESQAQRITTLEAKVLARLSRPKVDAVTHSKPRKKIRRGALSGAVKQRRRSTLKTSAIQKTSRKTAKRAKSKTSETRKR